MDLVEYNSECSHARNFEFAALNVNKPHTALLCVKAIIKDVLAGHTVAIMVIYCLTKIIACVHQWLGGFLIPWLHILPILKSG